MKKPKMGEWLQFNGIAIKQKKFRYGINNNHRYVNTRWIKEDCKPFKAMYIGSRVVYDFNFYRYVDSHEVDEERERLDNYNVWLVVSSEFTNPIYVFPEQLAKDNHETHSLS